MATLFIGLVSNRTNEALLRAEKKVKGALQNERLILRRSSSDLYRPTLSCKVMGASRHMGSPFQQTLDHSSRLVIHSRPIIV